MLRAALTALLFAAALPAQVPGVTIKQPPDTLIRGDSLTLQAHLINRQLRPTSSTAVYWTSLNSSASVRGQGMFAVVKGTALGAAVITAKWFGQANKVYYDTVTFRIVNRTTTTVATFRATSGGLTGRTMFPGDTIYGSYDAKNFGTVPAITAAPPVGITVTYPHAPINGAGDFRLVVQPTLTPGVYFVPFTASNGTTTLTVPFTVTVQAPVVALTYTITFDPPMPMVQVGQQQLVIATVRKDGVRITNPRVQWSPQNPTLVDVTNRAADDDSALVVANGPGVARIIASYAASDGRIITSDLLVTVPVPVIVIEGLAADTLGWRAFRDYTYVLSRDGRPVVIDPAQLTVAGTSGFLDVQQVVIGPSTVVVTVYGHWPSMSRITVGYAGTSVTTDVETRRNVERVLTASAAGDTTLQRLTLGEVTQVYAVLFDIAGNVIEVFPEPPSAFPWQRNGPFGALTGAARQLVLDAARRHFVTLQ